MDFIGFIAPQKSMNVIQVLLSSCILLHFIDYSSHAFNSGKIFKSVFSFHDNDFVLKLSERGVEKEDRRGRVGRKPSFNRESTEPSIRQSRISRAVRDELSEIISEVDIKAVVYPDESLLRSTSISDISVSPDLAYAKVFISVLGNSVQKRQVFVWLCENVGQVKYSLAKRLKHMKRVPDIYFKLVDNSQSAVDVLDAMDSSSIAFEDDDDELDFEEDDE